MKRLVLFLALASLYQLINAQVPQGFNYQAIARGADGKEIINTNISVKISILSDTTGFFNSGAGSYVWEEQQNVKTNNFGLFIVTLGNTTATKVQGSAAAFSSIDWKARPLYIGIKINNSGWRNMGTSPLWTVPYSMVAGELDGAINKLEVIGEDEMSDEALFEVKRKDGQTMFAVYNHGVRVNMPLDTLSKARKGGFAIGGFDKSKGSIQDYFVVNPDSIRAYIDTNPGKARKGGFAIGGFDKAKAEGEVYLKVTRDSTRINVSEPAKGLKGGFAIGSFSPAKAGTITNFTSLSPENYFIGHEAGLSNSTGSSNSFFGYKAGRSNTSGAFNVFIGHESGYSNTIGEANLFIGDSAGYQNTSGKNNIALGHWSSQDNTTGNYNISIGDASAIYNISGSNNISIGHNSGVFNNSGIQNINIGTQAGLKNNGGARNTNLGSFAGLNNTSGSYNVTLGNFAGFSATSGDGNVYLGSYAGRNNLTGNWNVFIGYSAGMNETLSQRLYIANSDTPSPLIYGEFDNGRVVINGGAAHNYADRTLFVNGVAGASAWFVDSDRRLKHDINTIADPLSKVLGLRGVNFLWNTPAAGMEGLQMGFIAQEAAEIVPEIVSVNNDHYSMQYGPVTALLVEAMKEQQKMIDKLSKRVEELETEITKLSGK